MLEFLIPLLLLILATIEDLKSKCTSDFIHYFGILFSYTLLLYYIISFQNFNYINLLFIFIIPLSFYFLYLFRSMGIGDVFVAIWVAPSFYYLKMTILKIMLFIILCLFYGIFINNIFVYYIIKKKIKVIDKIILILSTLFSLIAVVLYIASLIKNDYNFMIFSLILVTLSFIIIRKYKEFVEENLFFERTPSELVEGDWVEEFNLVINKKDLKENWKSYFKIQNINDKEVKIYLENDLPGLSKEHILILQELEKKGYNVYVKIKEGFPFVPAMLLAYITILFL